VTTPCHSLARSRDKALSQGEKRCSTAANRPPARRGELDAELGHTTGERLHGSHHVRLDRPLPLASLTPTPFHLDWTPRRCPGHGPMQLHTAHTREARTPSYHLTGTMRLTLRLHSVAAVSIPPDDGVAAAARRRSRRFAWPACGTETFLRRDRLAVTVAPPRQKAGAARPRRSVWRRPMRTHKPELLRCLTESAKSTHPAAVEKT
jgi:hypothetical protein